MRIAAVAVALAGILAAPPLAPRVGAEVTSDRPAALLIFPRVLVAHIDETTAAQSIDTLIQISNTATDPVALHCFYVDATSRCSLSDFACDVNRRNEECPLAADVCLPRWTETDFQVVLTPRQPLAWRASLGLGRADLPLDGTTMVGPLGQSNAGTQVPPVERHPISAPFTFEVFSGELKCIAVDGDGKAVPLNVLQGEASVVALNENTTGGGIATPVAAKYNAVGIEGIEGDANGDGVLELGGDANEYNGCANVLVMQHFFDGFRLGREVDTRVFSELTLVPCSQNLRSQIPGRTTAQFLVFNEFEQRFSTSTPVDCFFRKLLSEIDTLDFDRSIFSIGVAGTASGQTRIRGVDGGLIGVLTEIVPPIFTFELLSGDDSFNLAMQGDRDKPDRIVVPR